MSVRTLKKHPSLQLTEDAFARFKDALAVSGFDVHAPERINMGRPALIAGRRFGGYRIDALVQYSPPADFGRFRKHPYFAEAYFTYFGFGEEARMRMPYSVTVISMLKKAFDARHGRIALGYEDGEGIDVGRILRAGEELKAASDRAARIIDGVIAGAPSGPSLIGGDIEREIVCRLRGDSLVSAAVLLHVPDL